MSRPLRVAAWSGALLLLLLAVAAAALRTFDWNAARPWIVQRLSESAGRAVAIQGDLRVDWHWPEEGAGLPRPRVTAHEVVIGNPEWARGPHLATARRISFSVHLLPLLRKRLVVDTLSLDTPHLSLERRDDGTANWNRAGRAGGWQPEVRSLALEGGTVDIADAIRKAALRLEIEQLTEPRDGFRTAWRVRGTLADETLSGHGLAGGLLALGEKDAAFPLRASLTLGKSEVEAEGAIVNPLSLEHIALELAASGPSLAQLSPLTVFRFPETRQFSASGRLEGQPGRYWRFEHLQGKVGNSDLAGFLHFRPGSPRGRLEGQLASAHLDVVDLKSLIGIRQEAVERKRPAAKPAEDRLFSSRPFRAERWRRMDIDFQLAARDLDRHQGLPLSDVDARVRLDEGLLSLAPFRFGVAGGSLEGTARLDARSAPAKGEMRIAARGLKLGSLFPHSEAMRSSAGDIHADATLQGSGNSLAELAGTSQGEARAVMRRGALSKRFLDGLGMNLGGLALAKVVGDSQVKLNCAVADFDLKSGVLQSRAFVVDTADAVIRIEGGIDLGAEQLALTVVPQSKGVRLMSLRTPLQVSGPLRKPMVEADTGQLALKAGSAVALGVLAPVAAALLPLLEIGAEETSECGTLLAQAGGAAK